MDILDQISSASPNGSFQKAANTKGGVWKGPCPWCGGSDRFSIYPFDGDDGHYICNQCKKSGDPIQFERDFHGLSFEDAIEKLGIKHKFENTKPAKKEKKDPTPKPWEPRIIEPPPALWIEKATQFVFTAYKHLLSGHGKPHRDYLNSRGISNDTIKKARLGYNPAAAQYSYESFGLQPETDRSGKTKSIWIPPGIIIPYFDTAGTLRRIRIRNAENFAKNPYVLLTGGSTEYFIYPEFIPGRPTIAVEAELDGWCVWQAAGDFINVVAVGNNTTRPDETAHDILTRSSRVLCSFDNDDGGRTEYAWWKDHLNADWWGTPRGKDPGEAFVLGVDIRTWADEAACFAEKPSQGRVEYLWPEPGPSHPIEPEKKESDDVDEGAGVADLPGQTGGDDEGHLSTEPTPGQLPERKIRVRHISEVSECRDGSTCIHMAEGRCLLTGEYLLQIESCPKKKWWIWVEDENIEFVVRGIAPHAAGKKKRNR